MTDQHPITPPPELVWEWTSLANEEEGDEVWSSIATQAAQWGADQELEACCEWLEKHGLWSSNIGKLRAIRRPKPPSLKEQALEALESAPSPSFSNRMRMLTHDQHDLIYRALEALPND